MKGWKKINKVFPFILLMLLVSGCDLLPGSSGGDQSISMGFTQAEWPGLVERVEGLSGPEQRSTWTVGDKLSITFVKPLPKKFRLRLSAWPYGPNADEEFILSLGQGGVTYPFSLIAPIPGADKPEEVSLEVDNPQRSNILNIAIPHPISPFERGESGDKRLLGMFIFSLAIDPL